MHMSDAWFVDLSSGQEGSSRDRLSTLSSHIVYQAVKARNFLTNHLTSVEGMRWQ